MNAVEFFRATQSRHNVFTPSEPVQVDSKVLDENTQRSNFRSKCNVLVQCKRKGVAYEFANYPHDTNPDHIVCMIFPNSVNDLPIGTGIVNVMGYLEPLNETELCESRVRLIPPPPSRDDYTLSTLGNRTIIPFRPEYELWVGNLTLELVAGVSVLFQAPPTDEYIRQQYQHRSSMSNECIQQLYQYRSSTSGVFQSNLQKCEWDQYMSEYNNHGMKDVFTQSIKIYIPLPEKYYNQVNVNNGKVNGPAPNYMPYPKLFYSVNEIVDSIPRFSHWKEVKEIDEHTYQHVSKQQLLSMFVPKI
jgi:hypothetical protein